MSTRDKKDRYATKGEIGDMALKISYWNNYIIFKEMVSNNDNIIKKGENQE